MSSEVTSITVAGASAPSNGSLFSAVSRNDLTGARQILRLSTEEIETLEPVVVRGQARYTPLLRAIANKNFKMVDLLLNYGANPNARADDLCGTIPLNLAVQGGPALHKILDALLACIELDPNATDAAGVTALMTAALLGSDNYILETLVERGADVNKARFYGGRGRHTPLMLAAKNGHGEVVRFLRNQHAEEYELFNGNIAKQLAKGSAIDAFKEEVSPRLKSALPQSSTSALPPSTSALPPKRLRCGPSVSRVINWGAVQPSTSGVNFFAPESAQPQSSMLTPSTQRLRRDSSLGPALKWDAAQSFTFEESLPKPKSVPPESSMPSLSDFQPVRRSSLLSGGIKAARIWGEGIVATDSLSQLGQAENAFLQGEEGNFLNVLASMEDQGRGFKMQGVVMPLQDTTIEKIDFNNLSGPVLKNRLEELVQRSALKNHSGVKKVLAQLLSPTEPRECLGAVVAYIADSSWDLTKPGELLFKMTVLAELLQENISENNFVVAGQALMDRYLESLRSKPAPRVGQRG